MRVEAYKEPDAATRLRRSLASYRRELSPRQFRALLVGLEAAIESDRAQYAAHYGDELPDALALLAVIAHELERLEFERSGVES